MGQMNDKCVNEYGDNFPTFFIVHPDSYPNHPLLSSLSPRPLPSSLFPFGLLLSIRLACFLTRLCVKLRPYCQLNSLRAETARLLEGFKWFSTVTKLKSRLILTSIHFSEIIFTQSEQARIYMDTFIKCPRMMVKIDISNALHSHMKWWEIRNMQTQNMFEDYFFPVKFKQCTAIICTFSQS